MEIVMQGTRSEGEKGIWWKERVQKAGQWNKSRESIISDTPAAANGANIMVTFTPIQLSQQEAQQQ